MSIFGKDQGGFIKVISLTIGLTVGLVLIARVGLNLNFDRCIAHKERVYELAEAFQKKGEEAREFAATPGGAVPALCRYIPEIEVGTRWTYQFDDEKLIAEDDSRHAFAYSMFADSCFFDIFTTKIVQGDGKKILGTPGQCLISRRLKERMGGNVIGKTFRFMAVPAQAMTISGVFEDYDENSSFKDLDIIMSMPSIGLYSYDGTGNLMGNDRYHSFVRLRPDANMADVVKKMNVMLKEQLPWEELKAAGIEDFSFRFNPVSGSHMKQPTVRSTTIILGVVALVMLFTSVMNYILVVVSLLVGKARQVALRKVIGAPRREFYLSTLKEAAGHLLVALVIMMLLLFSAQDWIRDLLGVSVGTLFSAQTYLVLVAVCVAVLFCCGLLPGYIYSRIPMRYAYRLFSESKRMWKLSLLAFQIVLSTMLLCILSTIYRQYDYMLNKDLGYNYRNVAYIEIVQASDSILTLAREIEKLPCVERTSLATSLFVSRQSGNNVMMPGNPEQLFNYACLYWAEPSIIETMTLTVVQGRKPDRLNRAGWEPEVIVDEDFAEQLKKHTGWTDVIGQSILSTEFGEQVPLTIKAVVKDFTLGTLVGTDERPAMMICGNIYANYILIKFNAMRPEHLLAVQQVCDKLYPAAELNVKRYADELSDQYSQTQHTRDLILIGCLASLLITLIGLIGYVRDEVQRRSRELAIRKVMGAGVKELQMLFFRGIALIAVPSVVFGVLLGWWLSAMLMQQFADKTPMLWYVFVADAIFVLLVIALVVFFQTRRVANNNPIEYLKTE